MASYDALINLFLSSEYSDFSVTCHGETFPIHLAVVCPQSPFFRAMSKAAMKERLTRVIDMPADHPLVVKSFLSVLYTGNYQDSLYGATGMPNAIALRPVKEAELRLQHPYNSSSHYLDENDNEVTRKACRKTSRQFHQLLVESLLLGVQVYVISAKYLVPSAQLLALERVYRAMAYIIDEECVNCEESCLAEGVAEAIELVYSRTLPDAISKCSVRQSLTGMLKEHINKFRGASGLLDALEPLVSQHEDFAADMGRAGA